MCEIVRNSNGWFCTEHECLMNGALPPPVSCMKTRPLTRKERDWLEAEQRRLRYHVLIGTRTAADDRARIAEIKALLEQKW